MFFLFFVFIPRLIYCENSSNQRKSKLLSEIFNSHNLSFNNSRITRIFNWLKINQQLSNYKTHNDFEHQSLFSSKLNLDIIINQDEESDQDSNVDSIPSEDSPNSEEELAKENERRRQEILDRFHKKNRGIRQRNDRPSVKKQREMRRAKKNKKNQTENPDPTEENIEETNNTQDDIKEEEPINQKENENNSEENINNHQVQNETTESEIESNSQADKNDPQDTNSINNTEISDDTQKQEKPESSAESNKNEENQEQHQSSTVNSENQNNLNAVEENKESSEETNKENLEHQNDSSITEDNKGNQEDQNNTEESSEETKNEENSENQLNSSITEHHNSNTTQEINESSDELNKNEENSEHHKSENNKTEETNEKNQNTENEKIQNDQTQHELNKQQNENNSQDNQENNTNEESEQIDNDEPPEGPLDSKFEEDLLRNPFHEKKKELIKKMQESQSPEDKKEAKRLADEECNKAKPNTVSGSRNDCVCKPGYIGDNPITERGCWRCGDENMTRQRNGRQCYHQAKCIYPGRCICEGGLMGDGITKCESPLPGIISVKPLYNPLINMDETNDKPIIEGVKVFYRATYDFVPYMSYCKFDLQMVNDNQKLTKDIETNETKGDRIGFNDNFQQFQMINGAADKDKSISCLLPPNFYRYLSDSNKQNGKCKVSISFDGLNFTQFTEFDIKETSETSTDGKLLDLPPQRTPVPIRKNRVQQTRKPKVKSTGSIVVDKNILLISICIPLIVYALLWLTKPKHKEINEEEIPFLNVEDSHNKKTQYEGTRKRVIL